MKRRLIAFLCVLSMCLSLMMPAMVADASNENVVTTTDTAYHINPLYVDVISEEDLKVPSSEHGVSTANSGKSVHAFRF